MGMPVTQHYTADMVRHLNDLHNWRWPRYETVHGELLVSPAPRAWHQGVVSRLVRVLGEYLEREPVGFVFSSPADISWSPDVLVQPDVFIVRLDEARTWQWREMRHLLLAIEVLSPGSARADRISKRALYQEQGVALYWVVDADARAVEVWTPNVQKPRIERDVLAWHPDGAAESLLLPLAELFRTL